MHTESNSAESNPAELNQATGSRTIFPEWIWTNNSTDLPVSLDWQDGKDWPRIDSYGEVYRNGTYLAIGFVTYYFHVQGRLHLILTVDDVQNWQKLYYGKMLIVTPDDDFMIMVDEDGDEVDYGSSREDYKSSIIKRPELTEDEKLDPNLPF